MSLPLRARHRRHGMSRLLCLRTQDKESCNRLHAEQLLKQVLSTTELPLG